MKQKFIITAFFLFSAFLTIAQQIPTGSCGIVNIYDAAGNRTKRTYFCNNGSNPYPQKNAIQGVIDLSEKIESIEFQQVDALYPNPTSGRFSVSFSKALNNAIVDILDESGKIIKSQKAKGYKVDFNLSTFAAGIYYVRVKNNYSVITKKVVKQ